MGTETQDTGKQSLILPPPPPPNRCDPRRTISNGGGRSGGLKGHGDEGELDGTNSRGTLGRR